MNWLQTRVKDIEDEEIQAVVADLLRMARLHHDGFADKSLFGCLQTLYVHHGDDLKLEFLPVSGPLGEKMHKLQQHRFYAVCKELVAIREDGTSVELYDGSSLHSFLRKYFKAHDPAKRRPPTRAERWDAVVRQRRRNR